MSNQPPRRSASLLILLAVFLFSATAAAYAGNNGASVDPTPGYVTSQVYSAGVGTPDAFPADDYGGCAGCHGTNGTGPSAIALNGSTLATVGTPTTFTVAQGSTTTFTLTFANPAGKLGGGFLVMHNDYSTNDTNGLLTKVSADATVHTCKGAASGTGTTACNGTLNNNTEVMHEKPKANASGTVTFQFDYVASASTVCQTFEFGLWVNAVNMDNECYTTALDYALFRQFRITTTCDDSNSCTSDSCNTTSCGHSPAAGSCNDGNSCTTSDTCVGGTCAGTPMTCSALDQCHTAGTCSGGICSNPLKGNGTACNDGNACTQTDTCQTGTCTGASPVTCTAADQCHSAGTCNTSTGVCSSPAKGDGTSCNDGNACTTVDTCQSGTCSGSSPVTCTAADQCHSVGTCNTSTGVCSSPAKGDGSSCNDGSACTTVDTCVSGICSGGGAVSCTASDQCHSAGICNAATGVCSNPTKGDGAGCNDGNACTAVDTCKSGVCTGASPTTCTASDQCHSAGTCDSTTGACSNPNKTDGTTCSDGNACTSGESCHSGVCSGSSPVTCAAVDQCHDAGSCNPATGVCTTPAKANGSSCDDGNPCTINEACTAGVCGGGAPVVCTALDQCHGAGTCNGATGVCSNPLRTDGTTCNDNDTCTVNESCHAGVCNGGSALPCTASDQCHDAGTCVAGACTNPPKTNGVACNDGNACTSSDSCQLGTCTGGSSTVCNPLDQCHSGGTCNPATGACTTPSKGDGTPCDDGNACTQLDTCHTGACSGASPVVCPAPDQCHNTGTCNTSTGVCSNPSKTDGTACNDGKVCTVTDVCTSGVCGGATRVCNDGIACTVDGCSEVAGGCTVNTSACGCTKDADCDDHNACNGVEKCNLMTLACSSGTPVDCSGLNSACNNGTCSPATGACSATAKSNGTTCDDGNACTQSDTCQAGACSGASPVVCSAQDQCHGIGTCNTSTGVCSNPNKANNTACDDGNACTSNEACQNGSCTGGTGMTCTALDQCHQAGTCSSGTCTNPIKTNGSACDDGNPCTTVDACQAGACTGASPKVCTALDQCHSIGTCDTTTGACSNPNKGDGTICDDGLFCTTPDTCKNGTCGGVARVCDDHITCTMDGCSNSTNLCTADPSKCGCTKDVDCSDGNACNGIETCDLSTLSCLKGTSVNCSSLNDQCNVGTCNPANGTCSALAKADGTTCDDGNACTRVDGCKSGACAGASPVTCVALDQCHVVGACSPGTGICSNPSATDGVGCDDGNACTSGDACKTGACRAGAAIDCSDSSVCTADACDTSIGCVHPAGNSGTGCGATASCSAGRETLPSACNGSSTTCPPNVTNDCAPFACGPLSCLKGCSRDAECSQGFYCAVGGKCAPKGDPGATCSAGNQCNSSFCADGVCCNAGCSGQCEACNLPNKAGTCTAVTGKPVAPREACIGDGSGCDGFCDGAQTTACAVPGQSTQCRAPTCDTASSTATLPEYCDGSGSCPSKRTQDCAPGICGKTQCTGCSTNSDCPADNFCRGGVCKKLSDPGTKCSIDTECSSRHCVDGVCCNSDCTGQCEACNQTGHEGACTPVANGQSPAQGRPACAGAGSECGGSCDGKTTRSCVFPGPGVVCRDADCQNGAALLEAFCNGAGNCPPPSTEVCPAGAKCVGTLCGGAADSCVSDGDCNRDDYCAGGVCVLKKSAGATCNAATECGSGVCVDGYCCTQACTGQCEACNAPGNEGTCVPVTGAPRGSRQACASDNTICGGACDGVTIDRCTYEGEGTPCRPGKCTADLADLAAFCQGNGSCGPLQQQSCDPVGCDAGGTRCNGPCKTNTDCGTAQYCSAGLCVSKLADGNTCGASAQCENGNCVDGLCCDTACDGACETCDQVGHIGQCTPVAGAPRSGRPACLGSGACGGFCDGSHGDQCSLPGLDIACGVAICANGVVTPVPACNGNATCVVPTPQGCDPYECDPDGTSCLTTCDVDEDCAPGLVCRAGDCAQPLPDAGVDSGVAGGSGNGGRGQGGRGVDAGAGRTGAGGRNGAAGAGGRAGGGGATSASGGNGGSTSSGGGVTVADAGLITVDAGGDAGPAGSHSHDSGGCGCRVSTPESDTEGAAAFLTALGLVAVRRRRRRAA